MILQTEKFRDVCQVVLGAIDNKEASLFTETLELKASGSTLCLNVTNREYYTTIKFNLTSALTNDFTASVNAKLFLDLMSKITSPEIELEIDGNAVKIKGNGVYKIPLIYNMGVMMSLPTIDIANVTNTMDISSGILQSILTYNSKELTRGIAAKPVQKYYYVDQNGAITFTSGACVNSFTLPQQIQMLLSDKVVKLFKLFKDSTNVKFTMGKDQVTSDLVQTKVRFETPDVILTAKLSDSGLVSSVPVAAIRGMSTQTYNYSINVNKNELVQSLNRLMLFNDEKNYGKLAFSQDHIDISDWGGDNKETVKITSTGQQLNSYNAILNMDNLNSIISGCENDDVSISFGDSKAFVIKDGSIVDILPELRVS